jgi:hypothetical protein
LSWRKSINPVVGRHKPKLYFHIISSLFKVDDIFATKFEDYCSDVNGIFLNFEWKIDTLGIQLAKLRGLQLSKEFIDNGILFMWTEKSLTGDIIEIMEDQGFKYIENIVIAHLNLENLCQKAVEDETLGKRKNLLGYFKQSDHERAWPALDSAELLLSKLESRLPILTTSDLDQSIHKDEGTYFKTSKKTMLMFRRVDCCD